MLDKDTTRIARLTAILTYLQARTLTTATELAARFGVSVRTIYRDIRTLDQAGVPVVTEDGRGFSLLSGYRLPPVMFTEEEAQALVTAELIIQASKDESLITEFGKAIQKVRSVLPDRLKMRIQQLERKVAVSRVYTEKPIKSTQLLVLQRAVVDHRVVCLRYQDAAEQSSVRDVEPFAIYSNAADEWVLVAFCRLRQAFRSFSLQRIQQLNETNELFTPHAMTFSQYIKKVNAPV